MPIILGIFNYKIYLKTCFCSNDHCHNLSSYVCKKVTPLFNIVALSIYEILNIGNGNSYYFHYSRH